ncbi:MAG: hypothetical protein HC888_00720 [Candidatus Competibacteraceae bacterium]|nr:hypothetical protein [Candidatus Competibacteraceae bacterium]
MGRPSTWTRDQIEQLRVLMKSGKTYAEAGEVLGRKSDSVRKVCYEHGFELRAKRNRDLRVWKREEIDAAYDLRNEGLSCTEIGQRLGKGVHTVYNLFARHKRVIKAKNSRKIDLNDSRTMNILCSNSSDEQAASILGIGRRHVYRIRNRLRDRGIKVCYQNQTPGRSLNMIKKPKPTLSNESINCIGVAASFFCRRFSFLRIPQEDAKQIGITVFLQRIVRGTHDPRTHISTRYAYFAIRSHFATAIYRFNHNLTPVLESDLQSPDQDKDTSPFNSKLSIEYPHPTTEILHTVKYFLKKHHGANKSAIFIDWLNGLTIQELCDKHRRPYSTTHRFINLCLESIRSSPRMMEFLHNEIALL